jgi:TonB family protein
MVKGSSDMICAVVAVGHLWLAPVQTPSPPTRERIVPASEGRLFDMRSAAVWPLVLQGLKELGFSTEKVDRKNQALLTRWRPLDDKRLEWLPAPTLPVGYTADRIRFQVFVSPFAEPARVYVGSIVEGRAQLGSPVTAYNVPNCNQALMAQIVKTMGAGGVPVPTDQVRRRELALSLLNEGADECLRNGPPKFGPITAGDARLTEPRKIPLSEHKFLYPAGALKEGKEGEVRVELLLMEDGATTGLRLLDAPPGYGFEASAMGVASLLLYSPTRISGCPVPTKMTYTIRFRD